MHCFSLSHFLLNLSYHAPQEPLTQIDTNPLPPFPKPHFVPMFYNSEEATPFHPLSPAKTGIQIISLSSYK
jgi:hypothetical protein